MGRWFTIALGVALLQGAISFSPIDERKEAWDLYNDDVLPPPTTPAPVICGENNNYRLPGEVVPSHYVVHLAPNFDEGEDQFSFEGEVIIYVKPTRDDTRKITLHCNELSITTESVKVTVAGTVPNPENLVVRDEGKTYVCDKDCQTVEIDTQSLNINTEYNISMSFKGGLRENMRGFYRSWYRDENGDIRWMATTQFQPGHARQAFPCFDEPKYKATFDISITRPVTGFSTTLSNMPFLDSRSAGENKITDIFHTTPPTSTYLLAFIVSDYKNVARGNNEARPFNIYARGNIGNTGDYSLSVGTRLLEAMEEYTGYPYYELKNGDDVYRMNMKQAAIPDFSAGAMENWGLLTYRESLILYDEDNTNNFYKQRIANIISHEIAHMWFGNLVTCGWWNNLWLNEGFARFYQYFLTSEIEKDMGFETRFIPEQLHTSLFSDSATNAHPLTDDSVGNPTSVSNHFSTITYAKGASVLRMTQFLLTPETFQKGLKQYLKNKAFKTAEPSDLFEALETAAGASFVVKYDTNVPTYFETWTTQSGHPLLKVDVLANGDIKLTQKRFYRDEVREEDPDEVSDEVPDVNVDVPSTAEVWHIPITWTKASDSDFNDLEPSLIMKIREQSLPGVTTGSEWVIFNKQQTGFYRVNYDPITWGRITRALREDVKTIHEYNRAQIVDDLFMLARAKELDYDVAFNILSFLEFEDEYAPWLAAITGFNFARRRLAYDSLALSKLRREIIKLSTAVVERLGFNEKEDDTFMDGLFRMHLSTFLCDVGHAECIDTALTTFQEWRNGKIIPPNMRPWVYCNGLRYGSPADYDFFWSKYLETNLANEQVVMISAAGCTSNQPRLNRFLTSISGGTVENFVVRPQDYSAAVSSAVTSNEYNTMRVFQWLQVSDNFERAKTAGILSNIVTSIASRLLTLTDIARVQSWVNINEASLGEVIFKNANDALTASRNNLEFYIAREKEFNKYFDRGFEDILEISTTTPTSA